MIKQNRPILAKCGGFKCERLFMPRGNGIPAAFICPTCEENINLGIRLTLHERTGQIRGNYNSLVGVN